MHHRQFAAAAAPLALGLALAGSAYAAPPPASGPLLDGDQGLPTDVRVPPRIDQATVEHRRLAVSVTCGEDGIVRVRGIGKSSFDCADGKAVARLRLSGRLRGKLRIDARAGSMTVTRTLRPSAPRARLAAETISLNAGYQYEFRGCSSSPGWRRTDSSWMRWHGTTAACSWNEYSDEWLIGKVEWYFYLATTGEWIVYRIRSCGGSSSECRWAWVRYGF